jgi:ABC-type multidrug transport system ATPase subunit
MYSDCPVMVLDEPTANLDEQTAQQVMRTLIDHCREYGKTLITVTHSETTLPLFDRHCSMKNGRMEALPGANTSRLSLKERPHEFRNQAIVRHDGQTPQGILWTGGAISDPADGGRRACTTRFQRVLSRRQPISSTAAISKNRAGHRDPQTVCPGQCRGTGQRSVKKLYVRVGERVTQGSC